MTLERVGRRHRPEPAASSPSSSASGCSRGRTSATTRYYDDDALVGGPARGRRSCATASRPVTCACTRWRPSARPGSSSSCHAVLKQRNPGPAQQAIEPSSTSWPTLGDSLRASMLRQALRDHLGHGAPCPRPAGVDPRPRRAVAASWRGVDRPTPHRAPTTPTTWCWSPCCKGSVLFLADLVRALTIRPTVDFLAISRYAPDSGRVRLVKDLDTDITDRARRARRGHRRHRADARLTCSASSAAGARRRSRCARCSTSAARRILPTPLALRGLRGPRRVRARLRPRLRRPLPQPRPVVAAGDLAVLTADPDAYVGQLYGRDRRFRGSPSDRSGRVSSPMVEMELVGGAGRAAGQHARRAAPRERRATSGCCRSSSGSPRPRPSPSPLDGVATPAADDPRPDEEPARRARRHASTGSWSPSCASSTFYAEIHLVAATGATHGVEPAVRRHRPRRPDGLADLRRGGRARRSRLHGRVDEPNDRSRGEVVEQVPRVHRQRRTPRTSAPTAAAPRPRSVGRRSRSLTLQSDRRPKPLL